MWNVFLHKIRISITVLIISGFTVCLFAQNNNDLTLSVSDIRIEDAESEKGIYVYIRKLPDISSVMVTESAERDDNLLATYSYRTYKYNPENGDEKRLLNGDFIRPETNEGYYIIDSTPKDDPVFGQAFVLFLPYKMHFGYFNTRKGTVDLVKGSVYVSFRTFENPYADYSGSYKDNSFLLERNIGLEDVPKQIPDKEDVYHLYSKSTVNSFTKIAEKNGLKPYFVTVDKSAISIVDEVLSKIPEDESIDAVVVLDTTRSMTDDIMEIREDLVSTLEKIKADHASFRVGLVAYKDVNENYLTKRFDFTSDFNAFDTTVHALAINGGGDWPEAVYEGLNVALQNFNWEAQNKFIFLIGDAPAKEPPESSINVESVFERAQVLGVEIHPLIIPKP